MSIFNSQRSLCIHDTKYGHKVKPYLNKIWLYWQKTQNTSGSDRLLFGMQGAVVVLWKPFTAELACRQCGAVNVYEDSQQPGEDQGRRLTGRVNQHLCDYRGFGGAIHGQASAMRLSWARNCYHTPPSASALLREIETDA